MTPVAASPYAAFEALLQALKLQQRQAARSPKLFDVFGHWLLAGGLPADVPTAIGGPTLAVAGATNASPIVITTTAPHGLASGEQVTISLVQGNTAANGTFTITVTGPSTFTLDGSTGNGAWTTGGVVTSPGGAVAVAGAQRRASPTSPRSPLRSAPARRRSIRPTGPARSPTSRC